MYSASQKKRKPINQVNFSENCNDLSGKKFTLLQNPVYPLSIYTSYKMYWPCMAKHEPLQTVMSKLICAEYRIPGLNGVCHFENKGTF